jgi:hypothetical protein
LARIACSVENQYASPQAIITATMNTTKVLVRTKLLLHPSPRRVGTLSLDYDTFLLSWPIDLLFKVKSDWIHSFMTNFVPALAPTACVQYQLRRRGKDGSRQHR